MKLTNFVVGDEVHVGLVTDAGIVDLNAEMAAKELALPCGCKNAHHLTMEKLIAAGDAAKDFYAAAAEGAALLTEDGMTYAPAVTNPEKIICVGVNYLAHAQEGSGQLPDFPILFAKYKTALAAHNETIPLPKAAERVDYEAELVVVIGKQAKEVAKEDALDYVFGYTIGNDLSAREQQRRVSQWLTGKTPDKFGPVGPYIVTKDEIDGSHLDIKLTRNGVVKQDSNTELLIFGIEDIISYASQFITLKPGDIIFTGTMSGIIATHGDPWLGSGDELVVEIEGIGKLRNVIA